MHTPDAEAASPCGKGTQVWPADEHAPLVAPDAVEHTATEVHADAPRGCARPPPPAVQDPAGVGVAVGPYESPFGPLVRPIGPGGMTQTPWGAGVIVSLTQASPP